MKLDSCGKLWCHCMGRGARVQALYLVAVFIMLDTLNRELDSLPTLRAFCPFLAAVYV